MAHVRWRSEQAGMFGFDNLAVLTFALTISAEN